LDALETASHSDAVTLDHAISKLSAIDERQGRIVELRFFIGLSLEETADLLSLSSATVKREWSTARLWLRRELGEAGRV
jgi:RNA polymerase sigma-70 factor, ECF subfamily